jgi:hypothetical protein
MLMALLIVLLAKITCRNKHLEYQPLKGKQEEKETELLSVHPFRKTVFEKGSSFEELMKEPKDCAEYEAIFFVPAGISARTGKSVYLRKAHHDKIMKIIQVIGNNETTIFSYIDNVLKHHLETYQDEIKELYDKNNKSIF